MRQKRKYYRLFSKTKVVQEMLISMSRDSIWVAALGRKGCRSLFAFIVWDTSLFRCIATLKNDATNSLGVISSKKTLRSSLLHKLRKIPKAKIAFRCIPTCRGMGRQRIGNVRSFYPPADPTFIREKESPWEEIKLRRKKKEKCPPRK